MTSLRKKTVLWMIKKYFGLHIYVVAGTSYDHPRLNSKIISNIILLMVKASTTTLYYTTKRGLENRRLSISYITVGIVHTIFYGNGVKCWVGTFQVP